MVIKDSSRSTTFSSLAHVGISIGDRLPAKDSLVPGDSSLTSDIYAPFSNSPEKQAISGKISSSLEQMWCLMMALFPYPASASAILHGGRTAPRSLTRDDQVNKQNRFE